MFTFLSSSVTSIGGTHARLIPDKIKVLILIISDKYNVGQAIDSFILLITFLHTNYLNVFHKACRLLLI